MKNESEYAGLWERFLALLLDALFFCACFFPITRLVKGVWLMSPNDHNWVRDWFIFDPHFQSSKSVQRVAGKVGFREAGFFGKRLAYTMHFERTER